MNKLTKFVLFGIDWSKKFFELNIFTIYRGSKSYSLFNLEWEEYTKYNKRLTINFLFFLKLEKYKG